MHKHRGGGPSTGTHRATRDGTRRPARKIPRWPSATTYRDRLLALASLIKRLAIAGYGVGTTVSGEWVIAIVRILGGTLALAFTLGTALRGHSVQGISLVLGCEGVYIALSAALLVSTQLRPQPLPWRQVLAMVLDAGGISLTLHFGGAETAFLYPAYLWMIIGNGFRFGLGSIVVASVLSAAGFAAVIAATPFWRAQPRLTAGLLAALLLLPSYTSLLIARLQNARRQAESASRAKTLFLASVSHELRTPLHAIVGMGELLAATPLPAEQASMVSTIATSAETLLGLIENLLRTSSIEAGQVDVALASFDLSRLLAEVQGMVAAQARAKGLRLNGFITARTPLRLRGDARHLRQILLNLCGNAIKFTGEGSVTVAADGVPAPGGEAIRLRFEVADTGIGIAPEARERVFEVFTQADATVLDRYGGSGLGLAIVARLVRCMGGEVGIEGGPAVGSTFRVSVDVDPDTEEAMEDAPSPGVTVVASSPARAEALARRAGRLGIGAEIAPGAEALGDYPPRIVLLDAMDGDLAAAIERLPGKHAVIGISPREAGILPGRVLRERAATLVQENGAASEWRNALRIAAARLPAPGADTRAVDAAPAPMRVLVADDNGVNRMVMAKLLERAGHTAILAADGDEALQILMGEGVDVALLDVNMPVLNGIETAQSYGFTSLSAERRIPLIGVTADASPATSQRCLDAGMAACLVKPVRLGALLRALEQAVGGQEPAAAPAPCTAHDLPAAQPAPIDRQVLAELTTLGGRAFVEDVVRDFIADAERVIATLEDAAVAGDAARFRAEAHALCSSAVNVGAVALRALCEPWQHVAPSALVDAGSELMERLRREWQRTRAALCAAAMQARSRPPSGLQG